MITEDPQLETRLRYYGTVLRDETRVTPTLHLQITERVLRSKPPRMHRPAVQVIVAAAIVLVAIVAVGLLLKVRADELAKAAPHVTSVSPADGATDVTLGGEFRVTFATRPQSQPALKHEPADGTQAAARWDGTTFVVKYTGLRAKTRYVLALTTVYTSALGGRGHFEKRWSFTTELGPPPTGVPVIWYSPAEANGSPSGTQIALDWNGAPVGILHGPASGFVQSPDGSRLLVPGLGTIDQTGQLIGPQVPTKGGPVWADDSRQICDMRDASGGDPGFLEGQPTWLFAGPVEGPLHRVGQAGHVGGQSGPRIAACSFLNDRAVVVEDVVAWTSEVRILALSTGALIYQHQYATGQVASAGVASRDGRYLAEQTTSTDSKGNIHEDTIIRRTSDGAVLARLAGQDVSAFSWDGSKVITMPGLGSVNNEEVRLVDWQQGKILWRLPLPAGTAPGNAYVFAIARPGGSDFIVGAAASVGGNVPPLDQLWLVDSNGRATSVAQGPLFPAFGHG